MSIPAHGTNPAHGTSPAHWTSPAAGSTAVERLLLLICIAIGAVVRFTPSTPLWLDEALSVNIAKAPLGDIAGLLERDGHPPLYYWLLHGWIELFGDGAAAVRSLSGVLGLLAIGLVYVLGRRLGGPGLALVAAAMLAVSPYAVRYSSEARMYELVVVLVLAGWLLLDVALRRTPRAAAPVLAGLTLVSGALLLTHYWAAFLLATVIGGLVLAAVTQRTGFARPSLVAPAVALAAGGIFFVPWLPTMRYQAEHTGTPWASAGRPTRLLSETITGFSGGLDPEPLVLGGLLLLLAVLGVCGRRRAEGVVLGRPVADWRLAGLLTIAGTVVVGGATALVSDSAFTGRYASVFFPIAVMLIAAGVAVIPSSWVRVATVGLVAALSLATVGLEAIRSDRTQLGDVSEAIRAGATPDDLVVVCPDQLGPALDRLLGRPEDPTVVSFPELGDPRFVDWVDYAERYEAVDPGLVADAVVEAAAGRQIWLVWNDGYRIVGPVCAQFVNALTTRRPGAQQVVARDGVAFPLESASLFVFPAL